MNALLIQGSKYFPKFQDIFFSTAPPIWKKNLNCDIVHFYKSNFKGVNMKVYNNDADRI